MSPHTEQKTAKLFLEFFRDWGISDRIATVTTDYASDIVAGVGCLTDRMNSANRTEVPVNELHVRFVAYVVNLALKQCLTLIMVGEAGSILDSADRELRGASETTFGTANHKLIFFCEPSGGK